MLLLTLCNSVYAWRIEGNYLIIENGDNLWKIAHSLYGSGLDFNEIWKLREDKERFNNPSLIYDGMKFHLPNLIVKQDLPISIDTIFNHEVHKKMDSMIYRMDSSLLLLDKIRDNTSYSYVELGFEKILLSLILSVASGLIVFYYTEKKKKGDK